MVMQWVGCKTCDWEVLGSTRARKMLCNNLKQVAHTRVPTLSNFWHLGALALRSERQSAKMSEIKNSGLDQYGTEPFKQQQFGTAGIE